MRKVWLSLLLIAAVFAIGIMPVAQAYVVTDYYYPTYSEGGITRIKGDVDDMVGDRYTGTIRFTALAYGWNPFESEVQAWMIQRWTSPGGEYTTIKAYIHLTGLVGRARMGSAKLTLTLKAWWSEGKTGASGTYAETTKQWAAGDDIWLDQTEILTIAFNNPWQSGRNEDGSIYYLKMGVFVTGYATGGWWPWPYPAFGQGYLYFHTFGSTPCHIIVDHFTVTRSK